MEGRSSSSPRTQPRPPKVGRPKGSTVKYKEISIPQELRQDAPDHPQCSLPAEHAQATHAAPQPPLPAVADSSVASQPPPESIAMFLEGLHSGVHSLHAVSCALREAVLGGRGSVAAAAYAARSSPGKFVFGPMGKFTFFGPINK